MIDQERINSIMSADTQKKNAAVAAAQFIKPKSIIGVGTGSTVNHFIDHIGQHMAKEVQAAVSSSEASTTRLEQYGIPVIDLNEAGRLDCYIDGADESNARLHLIKGGGGALTREKIVAAASDQFICIADESKLVEVLGTFPLPVEVIPMARNMVASIIEKSGGTAIWREGFVTDNGNHILDISDLKITTPIELENTLNQIAGVVTCGLFASRPADILILGTDEGHRLVEAT